MIEYLPRIEWWAVHEWQRTCANLQSCLLSQTCPCRAYPLDSLRCVEPEGFLRSFLFFIESIFRSALGLHKSIQQDEERV